jgi:PAS domain S-box-containing protein
MTQPLSAEQAAVLWPLLSSLNDAVWVLDLHADTYAYLSPQISAIYGEKAETVETDRSTWIRYIHPEDRESVLAASQALVPGGPPLQLEYRIVRKDGSVRWIQDRKQMFLEQDSPRWIAGVVVDISQHKEQELALREAADQYHYLFAHHPLPMLLYDIDSLHLLEVNTAAVDFYGYPRDVFLTLGLQALFPPGEGDHGLARLANRPPDLSHQAEQHRKAGGEVADVTTVSHLLTFQGHAARLVMVMDVTAQRQAEHQLQRHYGRLQHIAWLSCHPLRRQVANMQGLLALADDNLGHSPALLGYLRETAQRLDETLHEMVAYALLAEQDSCDSALSEAEV